MFNNRLIRKTFSVVLLAIFALSNTPTRYLHQLFANHKDFVSKTLKDSDNPQLNLSGINCHCESNVVMAPYTYETGSPVAAPILVFATFSIGFPDRIASLRKLSFRLRGPPSMA